MDRNAKLLAMFDTSGRGLEIGPSYNPLVPKSAGYRVDVLDHASAESLRAKYRDDPTVDIARIEDVDYVWDGRPLTQVVGDANCYDFVVASHVIEHTPDMLGFLKECDSLLKHEGVLVLAVPDKRRCFDVLRPLSTTGAVLQAHLEKRSVHSVAVAFDHVAYFATTNGLAGWPAGTVGDVRLHHDLDFARRIYERSVASQDYFDFHAWTFSPSSFRMIVADLHQIGALAMREARFEPTPGTEFFITLSRTGAGCGLSRDELLRRVGLELREFPQPAS